MSELMSSIPSVSPDRARLAGSNIDRDKAPVEQQQLFDSTFNYFQFFLARQEGVTDDAAFNTWVEAKSQSLREWCDTTGRAQILKYVETHTVEEIEKSVGMEELADAYKKSIH